jgi:hypothetical protein
MIRRSLGPLLAFFLALPALAQTSVWSLTPEQRQKLLAEQSKQMQLTQKLQMDMRAKVDEAYRRQQLAAVEAQRAQFQATQAQMQANLAASQANSASMSVGMEQGRLQSKQRNMDAAVDMVTDAIESWQPPKTYTALAGKVELADPFSDDPSQARVVDPLAALKEAVQGTCLGVDEERMVAKIAAVCVVPNLTNELKVGDYPILSSDSSPLDTPQRVKAFLETANAPSTRLLVLRNDVQLVAVR